jgi:hypothetical protein
MKPPRKQLKARRWQPMQRAVSVARDGRRGHAIAAAGQTFTTWMNDLYTVLMRPVDPAEEGEGEGFPSLIHLSIRRNDRQPVTDWRHLQRIKNDLVGPEHEGVQLFPAESRLVDSSNQMHLYVVADPCVRFPFGFADRLIVGESSHGAVQRPFGADEPPDTINGDQFAALADAAGIDLVSGQRKEPSHE